jgi:hypothetical protein
VTLLAVVGGYLGALLLVEYLWLPYPTQSLPRPPHIAVLARHEGAVLTLPFPVGPNFSQAMYEQTRHARPMVGGYLSYPPGEESLRAILATPLLRSYAYLRPARGTLRRAQLEQLGIGSVVVHRDWGSARLAARGAALGDDVYRRRAALTGRGYPDALLDLLLAECRAELGPPVYEDENVVVFRLTPQ